MRLNEEQLATLSSPTAVREYLENQRENIENIIKQNLAVGDIFKRENLEVHVFFKYDVSQNLFRAYIKLPILLLFYSFQLKILWKKSRTLLLSSKNTIRSMMRRVFKIRSFTSSLKKLFCFYHLHNGIVIVPIKYKMGFLLKIPTYFSYVRSDKIVLEAVLVIFLPKEYI